MTSKEQLDNIRTQLNQSVMTAQEIIDVAIMFGTLYNKIIEECAEVSEKYQVISRCTAEIRGLKL